MPVRLGSKLPVEQEARIEIIPLIDIMFFLLAAFMLVSLSMVRLNSLKVDLPTATTAAPDQPQQDLVSLSVDRTGTVFYEKTPVGPNELASRLTALFSENPDLRVFISGDKESLHGDIIEVLDIVRGTGLQRVAFEIRPETASSDQQP